MTVKQYNVLHSLKLLINGYLTSVMFLSRDPQRLNEQIDNMIQQLESLKAPKDG